MKKIKNLIFIEIDLLIIIIMFMQQNIIYEYLLKSYIKNANR